MKKQNFFKLLSLFLVTSAAFAQVQKAQTLQVGNTSTNTQSASAALQIDSTTRGLLPPRMTQAQRNAIASPAAGLMVWCTDCGSAGELQVNNGTTWTNMVGGTASSTVPGAPTSPVGTAGNTQVSVAFTAPASTGGSAITGYTVTSSPGGLTATGTSSPIVVTGLTNGTSYTFTVVATNAAGNSSPAVSAAVTPRTVPGAPTSPVATAGNAQASVAFTAPASTGGSVITGYTVTSSPGGLTSTGASSPIVVTGLTNGTAYTFTVVATNAAGNSSVSTASAAVTPRTVPGAPTSPVATAGNVQASVAFNAPASNGGSAITGYTVTSSPGGFTATGASSPLVVTGLTNGTSYTFTVVATNAAGNSSASVVSGAVTPFIAVPGAPTSPVATAGNAQASVAFTAPASNGGSAITGYTVTSSPGGFTSTGASSPRVVTGLTNGTSYTFTVVATNVAGNSVASSASAAVTPFTVPGAPTSPVATAGNAKANVAFNAPASTGGSAITGYTVTSSPGGFTSTGASSPIVVTGLTNNTAYTFTVVATNAAGNSSGAVSAAVTIACGAFVASGVYKIFSCHNLGATTSFNPDVPVIEIHGNFYQWGRNTVVANASTAAGAIGGWNTTGAANGAWDDASKTANDPCPAGFRVPTNAQWLSVAANNTVSRTGAFVEGTYTSAVHFGPNTSFKTLTLPVCGYRVNTNGQLANRGASGAYWTTTIAGSNPWYFNINSGTTQSFDFSSRNTGNSVRCVSE